jgi:hypothetical protein
MAQKLNWNKCRVYRERETINSSSPYNFLDKDNCFKSGKYKGKNILNVPKDYIQFLLSDKSTLPLNIKTRIFELYKI